MLTTARGEDIAPKPADAPDARLVTVDQLHLVRSWIASSLAAAPADGGSDGARGADPLAGVRAASLDALGAALEAFAAARGASVVGGGGGGGARLLRRVFLDRCENVPSHPPQGTFSLSSPASFDSVELRRARGGWVFRANSPAGIAKIKEGAYDYAI